MVNGIQGCRCGHRSSSEVFAKRDVGVCSATKFHAFVVRYRAKEMVEKACGIIVAVDEFRLLIQVSSLDDREYRHRCNAAESREASF